MNYIILDLEWNASYSRKISAYVNEIIEFGAVKCDENLNIINTFSSLVRLSVGKKLSSIVSELTKIKKEELDSSQPFMQVASKFRRWAGEDCVILTWGLSDVQALIENFRYFSGNEKISFMHKYADMQVIAQDALDMNVNGEQLGLDAAADMLNLDVSEYKHHRALGDSLITLEVFKNIIDKTDVLKYTEIADEEFYKKMTFKTVFLSDIDNPIVKEEIDKPVFCSKCGKPAHRTSKWLSKSRKLMANFICKNCEYPFSERVQIKLKYEGVIVNRKDVPLPIFDEPRKAEEAMLCNMKLNIAENGVGYLTFNAFEGVSGIKHAFSTRIGGLSKGIFADMNLGLRRGDDDELVLKNFDLFCEAINVDRKTLVAGAQEHHTNIKRVTALDGGNGIDLPKKWEDVDGLCTNEEEITLIVYAADCVPLYFYDAKNRAIGLAHAGWRGTVSNMAGVMVERMAEEFGTLPEDLLCAIGPSIGPESFEVDPPCAEEFLKLDSHEKFVKDDGNGKFHVNLWETNRQLLLKAGVKAENISVGEVDSYKEGSLIFSHRRTRGQRGSNAAFLTLKRIDE